MKKTNRAIGYFPGSFFNRTERILIDDKGFHYRVREGEAVGPFLSEFAAHSDLNRFIDNQIKPRKLRNFETDRK